MNTDMNISEISAMVGYNDPFYFSRKFKLLAGCSPKEYRSMPDVRKSRQ
jgi:AraC-like DNA-binding protein